MRKIYRTNIKDDLIRSLDSVISYENINLPFDQKSFDEDVNSIVRLLDDDFASIWIVEMQHLYSKLRVKSNDEHKRRQNVMSRMQRAKDFAQNKSDIYANFMNYLIIIARRKLAIETVQIIWLHEQWISQLRVFMRLKHATCSKSRLKQNIIATSRWNRLLNTSFCFCFADLSAQ